MNHNRRSYAMDGLKLLFMLLIVVHHSSYYYDRLHHAYMAVDLFFMISGYLLIRTLRAKPQMGVGGYFLSRICKLYPHYLLSFAAMFLSTSVYKSGTITPAMLLRALPEMLLVQNLGIFIGGVNYPCWYLSVLVFAGVLIFFLGKKLPQGWFNALAVICAAVSYGFILHFTGGRMETFATVGMFYLPFWRGVAGLFCGTLLYQLHNTLQPVFRKYAGIFRVIELTSLTLAVVLMFFPGQVDGPILLCIFLLLLSVGSEKSVIERGSNCAAVKASIHYEYAVYLNHAFVIGMVKKLFVERFGFIAPINLAVLLTALVIYSVITQTLVTRAVQSFRKRTEKENT